MALARPSALRIHASVSTADVTIYAFDATVSSYELLKTGVTEARLPGSPHRHHRVLIEAASRDEAALIAAQMVSCIPGFVCTGIYDRV